MSHMKCIIRLSDGQRYRFLYKAVGLVGRMMMRVGASNLLEELEQLWRCTVGCAVGEVENCGDQSQLEHSPECR